MRLRVLITAIGLIILSACSSGQNTPVPTPTTVSQPVQPLNLSPTPTRTPIVISIPSAPTPAPAPVIHPVGKIAAGDVNSCAILADSSLKCWGGNFAGQLGQGHKDFVGDQVGEMGDALPPINLGRGRTVMQVAIGSRHICALLDDEQVKCWGSNVYGQLGRTEGTITSNPQLGDAIDEMGDNLPVVNFGGGRRAVQLAAGEDHTCALLDDDTVKCWGRNDAGQLGIGNSTNVGDNPDELGSNLRTVNLGVERIPVLVAAGDKHNCVIFEDNSVTCWGDASNNRLGPTIRRNVGISGTQMGENLRMVELENNKRAVQVTAGGRHSCALIEGGTIQCWGAAGLSGTIVPDDGSAFKQVVAGRLFGCGLLDNGSVQCWGENKSGQLGQGHPNETTLDSIHPFVDLGPSRKAVEIAAGDDHVCVLLDNNSEIKCWGSNARGQLGQGHRVDIGASTNDMGISLKPIDLG